MKIERSKNAARNMLFGLSFRVLEVVVPFFMRTILIYVLGMQYLGLSGLFTSILSVLNLSELGVGSAMVYSMYKPIAENDSVTICALLRLYRFYYRIIGLVVALLGLALLPFLPRLIHGSIPADLNLYVLYLLNLSASVLTYWMFGYKTSLCTAHQRSDLINRVHLAVTFVQYACQILALFLTHSYYGYLATALLAGIVNNLLCAYTATRHYPNYKPVGKLDKALTKQISCRIRDLFTSKLGSVVTTSADTIVISAFLGLVRLAIYQNYFYILTAVNKFVSICISSCTAGIGNSLITETHEKNLRIFHKLTFIVLWAIGFCCCCLLCLYQPFMKIWMKDDSYLLAFSFVICFCIYFVVNLIATLFRVYKDAGGIWHEDRFRPLITAAANLIMNLITVQFWGLYGVLLSTILSEIFIGLPWLLHNLFTSLFRPQELLPYLKKLFFYLCVIAVSCTATLALCSLFSLSVWGTLLLRALLCCLVPNLIFLMVYYRLPEFEQTVQMFDDLTKNRLSLHRLLFKK